MILQLHFYTSRVVINVEVAPIEAGTSAWRNDR